jgi:hypothetical protein
MGHFLANRGDVINQQGRDVTAFHHGRLVGHRPFKGVIPQIAGQKLASLIKDGSSGHFSDLSQG